MKKGFSKYEEHFNNQKNIFDTMQNNMGDDYKIVFKYRQQIGAEKIIKDYLLTQHPKLKVTTQDIREVLLIRSMCGINRLSELLHGVYFNYVKKINPNILSNNFLFESVSDCKTQFVKKDFDTSKMVLVSTKPAKDEKTILHQILMSEKNQDVYNEDFFNNLNEKMLNNEELYVVRKDLNKDDLEMYNNTLINDERGLVYISGFLNYNEVTVLWEKHKALLKKMIKIFNGKYFEIYPSLRGAVLMDDDEMHSNLKSGFETQASVNYSLKKITDIIGKNYHGFIERYLENKDNVEERKKIAQEFHECSNIINFNEMNKLLEAITYLSHEQSINLIKLIRKNELSGFFGSAYSIYFGDSTLENLLNCKQHIENKSGKFSSNVTFDLYRKYKDRQELLDLLILDYAEMICHTVPEIVSKIKKENLNKVFEIAKKNADRESSQYFNKLQEKYQETNFKIKEYETGYVYAILDDAWFFKNQINRSSFASRVKSLSEFLEKEDFGDSGNILFSKIHRSLDRMTTLKIDINFTEKTDSLSSKYKEGIVDKLINEILLLEQQKSKDYNYKSLISELNLFAKIEMDIQNKPDTKIEKISNKRLKI